MIPNHTVREAQDVPHGAKFFLGGNTYTQQHTQPHRTKADHVVLTATHGGEVVKIAIHKARYLKVFK